VRSSKCGVRSEKPQPVGRRSFHSAFRTPHSALETVRARAERECTDVFPPPVGARSPG